MKKTFTFIALTLLLVSGLFAAKPLKPMWEKRDLRVSLEGKNYDLYWNIYQGNTLVDSASALYDNYIKFLNTKEVKDHPEKAGWTVFSKKKLYDKSLDKDSTALEYRQLIEESLSKNYYEFKLDNTHKLILFKILVSGDVLMFTYNKD